MALGFCAANLVVSAAVATPPTGSLGLPRTALALVTSSSGTSLPSFAGHVIFPENGPGRRATNERPAGVAQTMSTGGKGTAAACGDTAAAACREKRRSSANFR